MEISEKKIENRAGQNLETAFGLCWMLYELSLKRDTQILVFNL